MLQLVQVPGSGELELREVPRPQQFPGSVTVSTVASAVSPGTERTMIEMGRKSLLAKARARPDLVKKVIRKGKQEGWLNALHAARSRLERPRPLGYSAAGVVEAVGQDVQGMKPGDRVAVAGAGYANHADVNVVPKNLVAAVPDPVSLEDAAYTTIAAIALQGVRLASPEIGERVMVLGLGLVGLIGVQLLRAAGCRVVGVDLVADRVDLGCRLGMDEGVVLGDGDLETTVDQFTRGAGADAVLITAGTESSEPVRLAGELARSKGRIVVVGNVGMDIPRRPYYEKELSVIVSRSYGPGRYDPSYEEGGMDYPFDYVRWTEQRNLTAVLDLMAQGKLDVEALTTHRFPFGRALEAYELIEGGEEGQEAHLGVLLEYEERDARAEPAVIRLQPATAPVEKKNFLGVSFVGAGQYAATHLLPVLSDQPKARLVGLLSGSGPNARQKAEKFGFKYCTSDFDALVSDADTDAVFIATRHSMHADQVIEVLRAGKHVFVEKPLAVSPAQLRRVREAYEDAQEHHPVALMVGLNRRFAPLVEKLSRAADGPGPAHMLYRVNAGHIPASSWLHRPEEGGGMLVGEMCHFVDLMMHVSGERPVRVTTTPVRTGREDVGDEDNLSMTVDFSSGSVGTLVYTTLGSKSLSKERFEVYRNGDVGWLEDFKRLEIVRAGKTDRTRKWSQDKGRSKLITATVDGFRLNGEAPVTPDELFLSMRTIFAARESLSTEKPIALA